MGSASGIGMGGRVTGFVGRCVLRMGLDWRRLPRASRCTSRRAISAVGMMMVICSAKGTVGIIRIYGEGGFGAWGVGKLTGALFLGGSWSNWSYIFLLAFLVILVGKGMRNLRWIRGSVVVI